MGASSVGSSRYTGLLDNVSVFDGVALSATLAGLPLYLACGFVPVEETQNTMPDGVSILCVTMEKPIDP